MGFPTHAHRQLAQGMVKTPERAMRLLEQMWTPAVARVREEVAAMREIARLDGQPETIAPWDHRYNAEKVRKAKYGLEDTEVKPYLRLDSLRDGMFWVAGELFGYTFAPAPDVPVCTSTPIRGRASTTAGRPRRTACRSASGAR